MTHRNAAALLTLSIGLLVFSSGWTANSLLRAEPQPDEQKAEEKPKDQNKAKALFNGKNLEQWKITKFGGEGDVEVKEGQLILGFGSDLTGVTYTGKMPKIDYEITLKAMRVDGSDFFCGLTFPVKDQFASLIVGGWGGGVCGISSLDNLDASENSTTTYQEFEKGKWYDIKLRVTEKRIRAWLDGKKLVDVSIEGKKVSTRGEVELSQPLGFASWQTTAALKDIKLRPLTEEEVKEQNTVKED